MSPTTLYQHIFPFYIILSLVSFSFENIYRTNLVDSTLYQKSRSKVYLYNINSIGNEELLAQEMSIVSLKWFSFRLLWNVNTTIYNSADCRFGTISLWFVISNKLIKFNIVHIRLLKIKIVFLFRYFSIQHFKKALRFQQMIPYSNRFIPIFLI